LQLLLHLLVLPQDRLDTFAVNLGNHVAFKLSVINRAFKIVLNIQIGLQQDLSRINLAFGVFEDDLGVDRELAIHVVIEIKVNLVVVSDIHINYVG